MSAQVRKPSRCTKCPNRPLRAQCEHTLAGKRYLQQLHAQYQSSIPIDPALLIFPGSTPQTQPLHSVFIPPVVSEMLQTHASTTNSLAGSAVPIPATATATPILTSNPTNTVSKSRGPSPASESVSDSNEGEELLGQPPAPAPAGERPKQRRAKASDPYNKHVRGAKRGVQTFEVVRKHPCPRPLAKTADATAYFARTIETIIERCEDVSVASGCWLFIGAQHVTARHGMVHYVSPRLRLDAPKLAEDLVNHCNSVIQGVRDARRSDAAELSQALANSEAEKRRVLEAAQEEKRRALAAAQEEKRLVLEAAAQEKAFLLAEIAELRRNAAAMPEL
ncbi:hypothetical protein D9611_009509 [Ephemerocybe angulata]|uniref:Uncharacterized protein n=1 Tax=Ephemerocybe angulata TaxID=980116 RepID=A0A8H5AW01_9AGAR|nr:hypothetical protein D9611_009509 [Tulosesus angulatus]